MEDLTNNAFKEPKRVLGRVDIDAMAKVVAASADVSLIVDRKGTILDAAFGNRDFEIANFRDWVGQKWVDTVTVESRPKVEEMLAEAAEERPSRWRQVNYPATSNEDDIPVLYSAVPVGSKGRVIVLGRELSSMAELQQRLMSAQQTVEREFDRLRQLETKYKLLFQIAAEAVVMVHSDTMRIVELNPTAEKILKRGKNSIVGTAFLKCFDGPDEQLIIDLLANVRTRGETAETIVNVKGRNDSFQATATLLRQGDDMLYLVRLLADPQHSLSADVSVSDSALQAFVQNLPDGFVVASATGIIISANQAFCEMVRIATEEQLRGASLGDFIGRQGMDLKLLLKSLKEHGTVRRFETTLESALGTVEDVEISAAVGSNGKQESFGLTIRSANRSPTTNDLSKLPANRSVGEMTKLVGRVPMKDLVRESTDMIERLCIEAALELTQDNRASAAEMLGLSRQSLYTKLHRFGLLENDE